MSSQFCYLLFFRGRQLQIQGEAELDIEMIREREEALRKVQVRISHIYIRIYAKKCCYLLMKGFLNNFPIQ